MRRNKHCAAQSRVIPEPDILEWPRVTSSTLERHVRFRMNSSLELAREKKAGRLGRHPSHVLLWLGIAALLHAAHHRPVLAARTHAARHRSFGFGRGDLLLATSTRCAPTQHAEGE